LIESAKFPGGWEIKFRDIQSAGDKIIENTPVKERGKKTPKPSYLEIVDKNPNLALAGLSIEIIKRLRTLAEQNDMGGHLSIEQLIEVCEEQEIFNPSVSSGLKQLIIAGNQAAHGATVEESIAEWAFDQGPEILAVLDYTLEGFRKAA